MCVAAVSWLARGKLLLMLLEGLKKKVKYFTSVMSDWVSKETRLTESDFAMPDATRTHMNLTK